MCLLAGCGEAEVNVTSSSEKAYTAARPGEYDSKDTAIITKVNESKETISFYNYDLEKSYTLSYDSVTEFTDKYGVAKTSGQFETGDIVEILFLKSGKLLTNMTDSASAFEVSDVTGFSIDASAKVFKYKTDTYKVTEGTILLSDGKEVTLADLDPVDTLDISGIDDTIYCVRVTQGHGILKVTGQDRLIDGTIELNGKDIVNITRDLTLTLPVGDYEAAIKKGTTTVSKNFSVSEGESTTLDLSDIELEEDKEGNVYFDTTPEDASVYIDGRLIDQSRLQSLNYGLHELTASADGYETLTRYFNVGEPSSTLAVELTEETETEEETTEKETDSSNTEGYYLHITAPTGAEVTLDGNYIGIVPVSVSKTAGSHTITLRKNGCVSRSYTILLENTAKDAYYSFEELEESSDVSSGE